MIDATGIVSPVKSLPQTVRLAYQDSSMMVLCVTFAPEIVTNASTPQLANDAEKDSP